MSLYHKGRLFEWKVRDELRKKGYAVFRFAGSKPVDLFAVKSNGEMYFVECKTDVERNMTKREINRLRVIQECTGIPVIIAFKQNGQIAYRFLSEYLEMKKVELEP